MAVTRRTFAKMALAATAAVGAGGLGAMCGRRTCEPLVEDATDVAELGDGALTAEEADVFFRLALDDSSMPVEIAPGIWCHQDDADSLLALMGKDRPERESCAVAWCATEVDNER